MTDEQLVALVHAGNLNAFNRLTDRWESSLYRYLRRMLGNAEDARDVCQEVLVKAYVNIGRLREGAKFRAWLHYIALNLCRDRFRSAKSRSTAHPYEEGGLELFPDGIGHARQHATERHLDRQSLRRLLEDVLEEIPVEQRSAIVLREFQGFSSDEIAEMTGVPAATVRSRIFYGLKSLRRALHRRGVTEDNFSSQGVDVS